MPQNISYCWNYYLVIARTCRLGFLPKHNSYLTNCALVIFGVMSGLIEDLNVQMNAPDNMLKDVMSGSKNVDIHDVMTAMAKSEISINVATQITGKVIQAYDKIMQIQV